MHGYDVASFREMDHARSACRRLRGAYARTGNQTDIKLVKKTVVVPAAALPRLGEVAQ